MHLENLGESFSVVRGQGPILSTLTGMVRVYDRQFLQALDLRELWGWRSIRKLSIRRCLSMLDIEEIPAHLHWRAQDGAVQKRHSSTKVLRHTLSVILAAFSV